GPRRQYRAGNRLARDAGTLPDGGAARADRDLPRELAGLVHCGIPLSRGELVDATARIDRFGGTRMKRLLPWVSILGLVLVTAPPVAYLADGVEKAAMTNLMLLGTI